MWAVQYSQQIAGKLEEGAFPGGTWKDLWSSDRTNGWSEPWIKEQSEPTLLMLLHTAEINTLLKDTSECGHGSSLKHRDFSSCYLCKTTFMLLFPTPLTFKIPLYWRSLNSSTCHSTLWAVIWSISVQVLKRVNCAAGAMKGVHSLSPCSAWETEKILQCPSKSESFKPLECSSL